MHGYIDRDLEGRLMDSLRRSPAVALLGPRQCGKSTLAKRHLAGIDKVIYLDLQDRQDRQKLLEPELFFDRYRDHVICLDEIQLAPEFFGVLRSEIDRDRRPGRFLILGSASPDLLRQSSESLAGRIAYLELSPLLATEVQEACLWQDHWLRGGFPESLLADGELNSFDWRGDYVRTFLTRDLSELGIGLPPAMMDRFWRLLAHYHGQLLNYSKLAEAMHLSVPTLKKYLGILESAYVIRLVVPDESNLKKRLVRSPKLYVRDSGVLHWLLDVESYEDLLGCPAVGASWEGYALEQIVVALPRWRPSFLRSSNGAEIDLLMTRGTRRRLFEFKASKAPKTSRGFFELRRLLTAESAQVVAPVDDRFFIREGIEAINVTDLMHDLTSKN